MADTNERTPLLKVEHLSKEFPAESGMFAKRFSKRVVSAVNDISFEIYPGETFGLVGESGCGKSTTGRTIMRLTKPTAGKVFFQGKDVAEMSKHEIKDMRREMQFIFQDPYASLNPRMTIGEIVSEPMTIHGVGTKEERIERVRELLDVVGLNPEHINRYPHEFSGGQRQRVGIARAFALKPKLIICDEPVSALDVSIQAQVLNLLKELQDKFGTAYLFIAHDLSVVQHIPIALPLCIWVRWLRFRTGRRSIASLTIRTRSRCCLPCRFPIRISRRPVSASSSPAIRRHRWIRRPAAVSTRAARSRRASALRSFPSLRKSHRVTAARATSRSRSRSRNRTSTCSRLLSFGPALKLVFRTSSTMEPPLSCSFGAADKGVSWSDAPIWQGVF